MQLAQLKRREFITLLGGAAAWPFAARGQQPSSVPVVGMLRNTPSASFEHIVTALRRGLSESGFVDGRNVTIEQRWAEGRDDRLPALLADLWRSSEHMRCSKKLLLPPRQSWGLSWV